MMCVKSNSYLIQRIFCVIDKDNDGTINFKEFLVYFNTLMNGEETQKAEFCFLLISAANEESKHKSMEEQFFTYDNLLELLILV
jgi:Ca2+-binding EF-hand superfamily protein